MLLPSPSSETGLSCGGGGIDEKPTRRGFAGWILPSEEGEKEREQETENQMWAVVEAIWEFAFLQVGCVLARDIFEWRSGVQEMYDHERCLRMKSLGTSMKPSTVTPENWRRNRLCFGVD